MYLYETKAVGQMDNPNPRLQLLKRCDVFRGLSDSVLGELAQASQLTRVERKKSRTGALRGLFVVGSGRARVVKSVGGRIVTLHYVGPGDVYGEGFVSEDGDDVELIVVDALESCRVPLGVVQRLIENEPSVARALLQVQATRRAELEARLTAVLTQPVEARVADFVARAAKQHGIPDSRGMLIGAKFTHLEIAEFVGATRETVTLVLGALKRDDIIAIDHRRIVVRDHENLRLRATTASAA